MKSKDFHKKISKILFLTVLVFLIIFSFPLITQALKLKNIRVGFHEKEHFTRVVLDLSGKRIVNIYEKSPDIFQIILPGIKVGELKKFKPGYHGTYIEKISKLSVKDGAGIEIKSFSSKPWARSFILKGLKKDPSQYRFVLDLFDSEEKFKRQLNLDGVEHLIIFNKAHETHKSKKAHSKHPVLSGLTRTSWPKSSSYRYYRSRKTFNPLDEDIRKSIWLPLQESHITEQRGIGSSIKNMPSRKLAVVKKSSLLLPGIPETKQKEAVTSDLKEETIGSYISKNTNDHQDHSLQSKSSETKKDTDEITVAEKEIAEKQYLLAISTLKSVNKDVLVGSLKKRFMLSMEKVSYLTKDYKLCVQYLFDIFHKWPDLYLKKPILLKHCGESLYFLKRYSEAPKYLLWYYNLVPDKHGNDLLIAKAAECFSHQGDTTLALKTFQYVIRHFPNSEGASIAKVRTAEILEETGKLTHGRTRYGSPPKLYGEVLRNNPKTPIATIAQANLASWYYRHHKYQEAASLLESLSRQNVDSTMLLDLRSTMQNLLNDWIADLYRKRKFSEIIRVHHLYSSFLEPEPGSNYPFYLAESYRLREKYLKAVPFYTQSINFSTSNLRDKSLMGLGLCWLNANYPDKAINSFFQIKSATLRPLASFYSSKACIEMEKFSSAAGLLKTVLSNKNIPLQVRNNAQLWLSFSQYRLCRYEEAIKNFEKIISRQEVEKVPKDELALSYFYEGNSFIALGRYKEGVDDFEKAIKINKQHNLQAAIAESLALICLRLENSGRNLDKELLQKIETINKKAGLSVKNTEMIETLKKQLSKGST